MSPNRVDGWQVLMSEERSLRRSESDIKRQSSARWRRVLGQSAPGKYSQQYWNQSAMYSDILYHFRDIWRCRIDPSVILKSRLGVTHRANLCTICRPYIAKVYKPSAFFLPLIVLVYLYSLPCCVSKTTSQLWQAVVSSSMDWFW